jgi:hypothetical protein
MGLVHQETTGKRIYSSIDSTSTVLGENGPIVLV